MNNQKEDPEGCNPPDLRSASQTIKKARTYCMKNSIEGKEVNDPAEMLRRLLGKNVLLLHWPKGKKGTKKKWKHLTVKSMNDPAYLDQLRKGNIGVVQGEKSGGLCSIDIDIEEEVKEFIRLNPVLKDSLRSKGMRGCNIWIHAKGPVPPTRKIQTREGKAWGELRSNGSQTIIHGTHPSGCKYQLLVGKPPVEIAVTEIVWPDNVIPPALENIITVRTDQCTEETEVTEETHGTDETQETDDTQEIRSKWLQRRYGSLDNAICSTVPSTVNTNHNYLFKLARIAKGIEKAEGRPLTKSERKYLFGRWYQKSAPFLRPDLEKGDYWVEFLNSCKSAKHPPGTADSDAWESAAKSSLPPNFLPDFDNPIFRRVIAFCLHLQLNAGTTPFFLSCRVLQKHLKHESHTTAAKWLCALVLDGFMDEIEKGDRKSGKATRYLVKQWPKNWLPPINSGSPVSSISR